MRVNDFDDMSPDQLRTWAHEQVAQSKARYAGHPVPRISRAKRDDYPHWQQTGWNFRLKPGKEVTIVRDGQRIRQGEVGTIHGLRAVTDEGMFALVVLDAAGGVWAARRADGKPWAKRLDALDSTVPTKDVPVSVWALTGGVPAQEITVEAPTNVASWTMRTLPSDEVLATYEEDLRD